MTSTFLWVCSRSFNQPERKFKTPYSIFVVARNYHYPQLNELTKHVIVWSRTDFLIACNLNLSISCSYWTPKVVWVSYSSTRPYNGQEGFCDYPSLSSFHSLPWRCTAFFPQEVTALFNCLYLPLQILPDTMNWKNIFRAEIHPFIIYFSPGQSLLWELHQLPSPTPTQVLFRL